MASSTLAALTASDALTGTSLFYSDGLASAVAADVKVTATQIKTWTSASPTLVTPVLGVATGTSLALGGATLGSNALAVTGTANISSTLISGGMIQARAGSYGNPSFAFGNGTSGSYMHGSDSLTISMVDGSGNTMGQFKTAYWSLVGSDVTISRQAAGVLQIGTTAANSSGSLLLTWLGWAGQTRVTSNFDKTNTTLADVSGLSVPVTAGKTYSFVATLPITADIAGGIKLAIAGTATATAITYQTNIVANSTNVFATTVRATALATAASATGDTAYSATITGTITVNAGGTLTVQSAQATATGTSSVLAGSTFIVHQF